MANVIVNFYPRPPRGGRPAICAPYFAFSAFLSTPSARRATTNWVTLSTQFLISIHALREEGDVLRVRGKLVIAVFLSTPSARRATNLRFFT